MFKKIKNRETKTNGVKLETIFPTAKDMLKNSTQSWPTIGSEEILKKMQTASNNGERNISFFKSNISQETCDELHQQGYKVEKSTFENAPMFKIFW